MTETELQEPVKTLPRVIRSNATGLYFLESDTGSWVETPDRASNYDHLSEIVEACQRHGLADVDLLVNLAHERSHATATAGNPASS